MSDYPGTANTPSRVDTPPTGTGYREEYVLWRRRASGGWFKDVVTDNLDLITDEIAADQMHAKANSRPAERYRLVRVQISENAVEVVLP